MQQVIITAILCLTIITLAAFKNECNNPTQQTVPQTFTF